MQILLTGASGFVGSGVLRTLHTHGVSVRPVVRSETKGTPIAGAVVVPTLDSSTDWTAALKDIDVVIHCAARAHIMRDEALDPLTEYRRVNVAGALRLAQQAAAAGVKRFIFISSIKVNGEITQPGHPYSADDTPNPEDAYGLSKAEAEIGLQTIAKDTGMELVVIRPVLVYGVGVKGNFQSMVRVVNRGIPLPLGRAINNRRSLVALDNLADFIYTCINHSNAAGQVFLVSDDEDLSTADLLRRIALSQGTSANLFPFPVALLRWIARFLGKKTVAQRLLDSLQVDMKKNRNLLDWKPPLSVDEGLKKMLGK